MKGGRRLVEADNHLKGALAEKLRLNHRRYQQGGTTSERTPMRKEAKDLITTFRGMAFRGGIPRWTGGRVQSAEGPSCKSQYGRRLTKERRKASSRGIRGRSGVEGIEVEEAAHAGGSLCGGSQYRVS